MAKTNTTKNTSATAQQWGSYERAYAYFNRVLFAGELPHAILNFSRKSPRTLGFFAPDRWHAADDDGARVHEISLNPETLRERDRKDVASTLVHEMVHLWRAGQPKPPRGGYHCKVWGAKMEEVGLIPSNTGAPGGKKTGQQMTHYIEAGGAFDRAYAELPGDCLLPFVAAPVPPKVKKARNKTKYACPGCGCNVWGKPDLEITCNQCEQDFEVEE